MPESIRFLIGVSLAWQVAEIRRIHSGRSLLTSGFGPERHISVNMLGERLGFTTEGCRREARRIRRISPNPTISAIRRCGVC